MDNVFSPALERGVGQDVQRPLGHQALRRLPETPFSEGQGPPMSSPREPQASIRFGSIYIITYIIGWVAFPLVIFHILNFISMGDKFIRYIVTYNWASVLQNSIYLPFAILVEAQLVDGTAASIIGLCLLSLVFLYTAFITKTALEVSNGVAAAIIVFDLILSVIISATTQKILHTI